MAESGVVLASVFALLMLLVVLVLLPLLLVSPHERGGVEGSQIEFEEDDGEMQALPGDFEDEDDEY